MVTHVLASRYDIALLSAVQYIWATFHRVLGLYILDNGHYRNMPINQGILLQLNNADLNSLTAPNFEEIGISKPR